MQPRYTNMEIWRKYTELLMRLFAMRHQNGSRCMGAVASKCVCNCVYVCEFVCVRLEQSHRIANEANLVQICVAFLSFVISLLFCLLRKNRVITAAAEKYRFPFCKCRAHFPPINYAKMLISHQRIYVCIQRSFRGSKA